MNGDFKIHSPLGLSHLKNGMVNRTYFALADVVPSITRTYCNKGHRQEDGSQKRQHLHYRAISFRSGGNDFLLLQHVNLIFGRCSSVFLSFMDPVIFPLL